MMKPSDDHYLDSVQKAESTHDNVHNHYNTTRNEKAELGARVDLGYTHGYGYKEVGGSRQILLYTTCGETAGSPPRTRVRGSSSRSPYSARSATTRSCPYWPSCSSGSSSASAAQSKTCPFSRGRTGSWKTSRGCTLDRKMRGPSLPSSCTSGETASGSSGDTQPWLVLVQSSIQQILQHQVGQRR